MHLPLTFHPAAAGVVARTRFAVSLCPSFPFFSPPFSPFSFFTRRVAIRFSRACRVQGHRRQASIRDSERVTRPRGLIKRMEAFRWDKVELKRKSVASVKKKRCLLKKCVSSTFWMRVEFNNDEFVDVFRFWTTKFSSKWKINACGIHDGDWITSSLEKKKRNLFVDLFPEFWCFNFASIL